MSAPAFAPERREIWYSDGYSGFYACGSPTTCGRSPAEPAPAPADRAAAGRARPASRRSGALPATGTSVPNVFVATTALGALLLLWVLRGTRPAPRWRDSHGITTRTTARDRRWRPRRRGGHCRGHRPATSDRAGGGGAVARAPRGATAGRPDRRRRAPGRQRGRARPWADRRPGPLLDRAAHVLGTRRPRPRGRGPPRDRLRPARPRALHPRRHRAVDQQPRRRPAGRPRVPWTPRTSSSSATRWAA